MDRLSEIRARCEAATPGPWFNFGDWLIHTEIDVENKGIPHEKTIGSVKAQSAAFIARAREDIPYLLEQNAQLRAEIGRLLETNKALENDNYNAEMNLSQLTAEVDRPLGQCEAADRQAAAEAKYEALFHAKMGMVLQMGQDAATMAAHESLGMGPGRAEAFCTAYKEAVDGMARMMWEDQKDDAEYAYTRAKVDEQIRAIVGEDKFQPWEERYG